MRAYSRVKAYSQDLRDRVILLYTSGDYNIKQLSHLFKICRQTISSWITKYKENGDYSSRQHEQSGRAARFTDKEKVIRFLESNPDAQGIEIRDAVSPELPMSTFYDTLKRMNITYKKRA